jgi:hypothetical protein
MLNTWLPLLIRLRFLAKSVSFGLSRLRWRAHSSSRSSLSGRLRSFISSVTHTPSRKYALWSSFGHASLGNSKPAVSQRSSNSRSGSCSWTRCVAVGSSISSGVAAAKALVQRFRMCELPCKATLHSLFYKRLAGHTANSRFFTPSMLYARAASDLFCKTFATRLTSSAMTCRCSGPVSLSTTPDLYLAGSGSQAPHVRAAVDA